MTTEKKSVSRLVNIQHENNEETEFYPSTQEIVDKVAEWLSKSGSETQSILDIGCGNGWIHSKEEAKEEFGLSETEINQYWNYNLKIGIGEGRNLLRLPDAMEA